MNHGALLRRAFDITRHHRSLWIFGFLMALLGGGSGGANFASNGSSGGPGRTGMDPAGGLDRILASPDLPPAFRPFLERLAEEIAQTQWDAAAQTLVPLICGALACMFVIFIALVVLHYIARAALMRMVDAIETGQAPTWREGFRLGRTGRTFRLFLLELVVGLVVAFTIAAIIAMAVVPVVVGVVASESRGGAAGMPFWLMAGAIICCLIPFGAVLAVVLGMLGQLWSREVVIADRGIGDAIGEAIELFRERIGDVGLLWLSLVVLSVAWLIVLIPAVLIGLLVGGVLGLLVGYVVFLVSGSAIAALVVGIPFAMIGMAIVVGFVQGLWEVFNSAAWTLAWRELRGLPGGMGAAAPSTPPMPAGDAGADLGESAYGPSATTAGAAEAVPDEHWAASARDTWSAPTTGGEPGVAGGEYDGPGEATKPDGDAPPNGG